VLYTHSIRGWRRDLDRSPLRKAGRGTVRTSQAPTAKQRRRSPPATTLPAAHPVSFNVMQ
jgi:hypothetical protein